MAYTVSGSDLYQEIAYHLMEIPVNGSAEPTSGLYTRDSIMTRVNHRAAEFNKRTRNFIANKVSVDVDANDKNIDIPIDMIDLIDMAFDSPTNGFTVIPPASVYEEDLLDPTEHTPTDTPSVWVYDESPRMLLSLMPPPDSTTTCRFHYTKLPEELPSPPDSTILEISDDLTPFVKYGALADLFGQSGETYDPYRKQVCEMIFELGVEAAQTFVRGAPSIRGKQ